MKRPKTIRDIYHTVKEKHPDAYIAIQAGVFITFILEQATEVGRMLGETVSDDQSYRTLNIHILRFPQAVNTILLTAKKKIVWVERIQNGTIFTGIRTVKVFDPEQPPQEK